MNRDNIPPFEDVVDIIYSSATEGNPLVAVGIILMLSSGQGDVSHTVDFVTKLKSQPVEDSLPHLRQIYQAFRSKF